MTWSLVGAGVLVAAAFGLYAAGQTTVASPGPLALSHAALRAKCEECHRPALPRDVANSRCERCHDPRATGRLGDAAHASWIASSQQRIGARPRVSCAHCHTDHTGPSTVLRAVDSRECTTCHGFSGVARHPEFAVVAAGRRPLRGLTFGHAQHIQDVRRVLGRGCEACHRLTADLSTFEPISFDRHCAVCHLADGVLPAMTDPIPDDAITGAERQAPSSQMTFRRPRPDRVVVSGIRHADPWILQAVERLNRGLETTADAASRNALARRLAALDQVRRAGALSSRSTAALQLLQSDLVAKPSAVADVAVAPPQPDGNAAVQRLEQQVSLELERRAGGGAAPISLAASLGDDRALEAAITETRAQLVDLGSRASPAPLTSAERAARMKAIQALLVPCLVCHQLQEGTRLAPVVQAPRFSMARFTHAPHVAQVTCDTCHQSVSTSNAATDVLTPSIQTCRTCHGKSVAPIECTACHRYHPTMEAGLGIGSAHVR